MFSGHRPITCQAGTKTRCGWGKTVRHQADGSRSGLARLSDHAHHAVNIGCASFASLFQRHSWTLLNTSLARRGSVPDLEVASISGALATPSSSGVVLGPSRVVPSRCIARPSYSLTRSIL